jgi:hypothetical protein
VNDQNDNKARPRGMVERVNLATPCVRGKVPSGSLTIKWFVKVASVEWTSGLSDVYPEYFHFESCLQSTGFEQQLILRLRKNRFRFELLPRVNVMRDRLDKLCLDDAEFICCSLPQSYAAATDLFEGFQTLRSSMNANSLSSASTSSQQMQDSPKISTLRRSEAGSD